VLHGVFFGWGGLRLSSLSPWTQRAERAHQVVPSRLLTHPHPTDDTQSGALTKRCTNPSLGEPCCTPDTMAQYIAPADPHPPPSQSEGGCSPSNAFPGVLRRAPLRSPMPLPVHIALVYRLRSGAPRARGTHQPGQKAKVNEPVAVSRGVAAGGCALMVAMQRSSAHVAAATQFGVDLVRRSDPSPHPRAAIPIPMLARRYEGGVSRVALHCWHGMAWRRLGDGI